MNLTSPLARQILTRGAGVLVAALAALAVLASNLTWRADNWLYDHSLLLWQRPASGDITIVAIDSESLTQIGRWPWPRGVYAQMIDRLTEAGARGVLLDLVLDEENVEDPAGDEELAVAIARNGRVVLPVLVEAARHGGPIEEILPIPPISAAAAALGHVDVALDGDGIAREVYLYAGLDTPHWPALALALLDVGGASPASLPGLRNPDVEQGSPFVWVRDFRNRIPYAGAPGHFGRFSFGDVLVNDNLLPMVRGRWVLIGSTATAMANRVATPLSLDSGGMVGVEYHANILDMLASGMAVQPLPLGRAFLITLALVALPFLLHGLPGMRHPRRVLVVAAAACLLTSLLLLRLAHLWFPPGPVLLVLGLCYAAWAMGYLRRWRRLANLDSLTQLANRRHFDSHLEQEIRAARRVHRPLSLVLIDIDHFKRYNDTYGHRAGDGVLRQVAAAIAAHARRPRDLAARFGGDEFALLMPETPEQGALQVAEAVLAGIRALGIAHVGGGGGEQVTVSMGVYSVIPGDETQASHLYEGADSSLYRAKQRGRDRIEQAARAPAPAGKASPRAPAAVAAVQPAAGGAGDEVSQLREEVRQLKVERRILGEAAAWLAREIRSAPEGGEK